MNQLLRIMIGVGIGIALNGCASDPAQQPKAHRPTTNQVTEADRLIEQLVFNHHPKATDEIVYSPGLDKDDDAEYEREFQKCRQAFDDLRKLKPAAFPQLVAHLDDKRPSLHFRNHFAGHSVRDACYWNIYFQLQDRPEDYSSYGYQRKGRDGKSHPKPYWEGTPSDEAGGLKQWLEANKGLSYPEMQIKCLNWLLEKELAIGAPDAESYFENILPLQIRILERKQDTGADVAQELDRLRKIRSQRIISEIPAEMLPATAQTTRPILPQ